jgi:hypothetical protein
MPKLARFSLPAGLQDSAPAQWNQRVGQIVGQLDPGFPQFYDPRKVNTPAAAARPMVRWTAFPARLVVTVPAQRERWRLADGDRRRQDEYCEWAVTRNSARKITKVTFTTELPEYFEHLNDTNPQALVRLYRRLVDPAVKLADLRRASGSYNRANKWNRGANLAHLTDAPNTLEAAAILVAEATIPRRAADGTIITNQQELVLCGGLGDHLRNSDPQIAEAVNAAAREGDELALADPVGLYLGTLRTTGMTTPDGFDPAKFWKIERGDADHTLRARFEVPPARGYTVGDIKIGGRPIEFGGQVADRVPVWITVIVKPGDHKPKAQRCVG